MSNKNNKLIILAVAISAAALIGGFGAAIAYGQTHGQNPDDQQRGQLEQLIKDKLSALSGVQSERVCDVPTAGNAACDARVVVGPSKHGPGGGGLSPTQLPPPGSYGPKQLLGGYSLSGLSSSTTSPLIAVVDAYNDPKIANDLAKYSSTFGIPQLPACSGSIANSSSACFQKLNQYGRTSSFPKANSSWDLEIALDVEVAHATCQNCRIALVEASSNSFSNLLKAVDTAVSEGAMAVSGSWGGSEFSGETAYDSHFNKNGVAFVFSSGDNGYSTFYPAASPYVTSVGGTTLLLNNDNSYLSESVWKYTGSGCSTYEPQPTWQHPYSSICANRIMNDVSADADPATGAAVYDSVRYNGVSGWFQVGGTSLSAPIIASAYALHGATAGVPANSLPYQGVYTVNLNDVTSGSNGTCSPAGLCTAGPSYDGPSGMGTPIGTTAF